MKDIPWSMIFFVCLFVSFFQGNLTRALRQQWNLIGVKMVQDLSILLHQMEVNSSIGMGLVLCLSTRVETNKAGIKTNRTLETSKPGIRVKTNEAGINMETNKAGTKVEPNNLGISRVETSYPASESIVYGLSVLLHIFNSVIYPINYF